MARRTRRTVSVVALVLVGVTPLSGCAGGEEVGWPSPSPTVTAAPLGPAPVGAPTCPPDPLAALPGREGGAAVGTVPATFAVRGLVRCVVTAPAVRGSRSTTYTVTRDVAPLPAGLVAALDAPDDPRPTPPEMCGSRAPVKPYLLLTDTAGVEKGTRAVRPRVPDDGCGSAQPAVLEVLAAAAWTTVERRAVTLDH